jgi:Xaa-Pro aminopeptidase
MVLAMLLTQLPDFFAARRDKLVKAHPGAVFIFPSNEETLRNPDVHYAFRQESNFYYLTGFEEPDSFLVLSPSKGKCSHRTTLFVRHRDPIKEMWEGERYGVEGALKVFGATDAYVNTEFDEKLFEILKGSEKVFYRMGVHEKTDRRVLAVLEKYRQTLGRSGASLPPIADPGEFIAEMRLFKSPEEVDRLRKASKITALAHTAAMKEVRPGMNEFEIDALVTYELRRNGCQRLGYDSIIAGGKNATCLHYRANNETLRDGDLLLIDAGGEFDYYTADVTRTFPVGEGFTRAQERAYDLVLKAQKEAIAMTKPGVKIPEIHKRTCEILTDGLLSMGLLKGTLSEAMAADAFKKYYPHGTSHWLGMDVHDVGRYQKEGTSRALEAGMVFTIEPGFYVQPADAAFAGEYKGIGIRIEDDILVTEKGCEVLTKDAPKERADIEAL